MHKSKLIRAWKDIEFRESLSDAERRQLSANPAGMRELSDDLLSDVAGGCETDDCSTLGSCSLACFQEDEDP